MSKWPSVPLEELCEILDSKRKPVTKSVRTKGSVPYYGATGILDYVEDYIFDEKLVLLGEDGAKWNAGDNSAFIIEGKTWVNNHAHVLRPNRKLIRDEWLTHYLCSIDLSEYVSGVTVPKLNQGRMRSIPIPVPPISEQDEILERLEEALAELDQVNSEMKSASQLASELQSSIIGEILTSGASNTGFECSLGDICEVSWGNTNLTKKSFVEGGKYAAVSAAGIDGRIDHFEHKARTPVLSAIGANCGRMFFPEEDFTAIKNTITLTPKNGKVDGAYLYRLLQAIDLPKRGAGQPFISKGDIESFQVKILPFELQLSAVNRVDLALSEIDELVNLDSEKEELVEEFRGSLMSNVFAGEF